MRRYLKILEEVLEVVTDESGGQAVRRVSESMDVQLDRWLLEQTSSKQHAIVVRYDLDTVVETDLLRALSSIVNTMAILYVRVEDLSPYGVLSDVDPIEQVMYQEIYKHAGDSISGRVLFLCPSPLMRLIRSADVEISSSRRGESDPLAYGDNLYDVIIADRELSRSYKPEAVVDAVLKSLRVGGAFILVEDGYAHREALRSFSREGLKSLLQGFSSVEQGSSHGNALGVIHKISSGGGWLPAIPDIFVSGDSDYPVYVWALARK